MTEYTAHLSVRLYRGKPVKRMHVMVKPTGALCNLDCTYCYYLSKQELLGKPEHWRMSDDVLEAFIRQYFEGQNHKEVVFSWQGGEPTLLGLDFFRKAVDLEKKYCPPHVRCENDLQTNGTNLDDTWCRFLRDENFLVGLSIDGPEYLHDVHRRDRSGKGSFDRVLRAARLLKKYKINFETLSCVNRMTGKHPLKVYRFLRDEIGSTRMQFIPIVEPVGFRQVAPQRWDQRLMPLLGVPESRPGNPGSIVEEWSVDPDDWGDFLCTVFDEWRRHDLGKIYVNYFEAAVETWMGHVSPLCTQSPLCGKGMALERDGSVYACDHYVYPEYRAGNILERTLGEMAYSELQERFGKAKEGSLPAYCRKCEYQFTCFGECPKNRFIRTPDGEAGLNCLCSGWKKFFSHIDEPVQRIVRSLGATVVKEVRERPAEHWIPVKK
ncbi:MAG TPA: anaerobic sulfatase maturase [Nitrospirota bacterium]|nr:anaerobic sulfatase maturase [Nitrospirota bacterium]